MMTRSVWSSREDILSCNPSIYIKCVYRPETRAHDQRDFLEKLKMGDFVTRFLKSSVLQGESGKASYSQGQKNMEHG